MPVIILCSTDAYSFFIAKHTITSIVLAEGLVLLGCLVETLALLFDLIFTDFASYERRENESS